MKPQIVLSLGLFAVAVWGCGCASTQSDSKSSFPGPLGLQLYSLREQFKQDVPATLDKVKSYGIQYAELAGTYNLSPEKFRAELLARGIQPISGHFPFERYRDDVEGIAREAKAL